MATGQHHRISTSPRIRNSAKAVHRKRMAASKVHGMRGISRQGSVGHFGHSGHQIGKLSHNSPLASFPKPLSCPSKVSSQRRPQRDSNPQLTLHGDLYFAYLRAKQPKIRPKIPPAIPPQCAMGTEGRNPPHERPTRHMTYRRGPKITDSACALSCALELASDLAHSVDPFP
jgi:hypothetical protein